MDCSIHITQENEMTGNGEWNSFDIPWAGADNIIGLRGVIVDMNRGLPSVGCCVRFQAGDLFLLPFTSLEKV
jgi:hypothetical protein